MYPKFKAIAMGWTAVFICLSSCGVGGQDVSGYSVLKGRFLNQTGPGTLVLDPDFNYSFLASVDSPDFDLVTDASLRLPNGRREELTALGDYWAFLDSQVSYSSLTAAYGWGRYTLDFTTENEGSFSCELDFPNTTLPPNIRMVNFNEVQFFDAAKPLILQYDFSSIPLSNDVVQVYINQGHAEVYATPALGEPGALDPSMRSVTIPPDTLTDGATYSLNLEITRIASTNSNSYPGATGFTATFSSTSVIISAVRPPQMMIPSSPEQGQLTLMVRSEPELTLVLQSTDSFAEWQDVATNSSASGTNIFRIPTGSSSQQFYRTRLAD